ncbi:MAG: DUF5777 family beta-barrel protein [Bacteroidales bacterium]
MNRKSIFYYLLCLAIAGQLHAQNLDSLLNSLSEYSAPQYTFGTFKGTTIINGQSVEIPENGDLNFKISHRFGAVKLGVYELFGIDQATTRFGFEYGIGDMAALSLGRSSYEKTFDGGLKIRLLRQQTGTTNMPVSVGIYSAAYIKTLKWEDPDRENLFSSRLSYATQLLIARKFSQKLSLQLTPSYVHKNLVPAPEDQNNIFATGIGGRYKISRKISVNGEYYYLFPGKTADDYVNSLSLGFDIETGGHVFQLQFTNSKSMIARGFIAETTGEWLDGFIYFGFNISRVFNLGENRKNIY